MIGRRDFLGRCACLVPGVGLLARGRKRRTERRAERMAEIDQRGHGLRRVYRRVNTANGDVIWWRVPMRLIVRGDEFQIWEGPGALTFRMIGQYRARRDAFLHRGVWAVEIEEEVIE